MWRTGLRSHLINSEAASRGWASRNRFSWLTSQFGDAAQAGPPGPWVLEPDTRAAALLVYQGKKAIPGIFRRFQCLSNLVQVMRGEVPGDTPSPAISGTFQTLCAGQHGGVALLFRCEQISPAPYADHSLVWCGQQCWQLSPDDRSQYLGVPAVATAAVKGRHAARVRDRNSL